MSLLMKSEDDYPVHTYPLREYGVRQMASSVQASIICPAFLSHSMAHSRNRV
jgi:hypothetical protein